MWLWLWLWLWLLLVWLPVWLPLPRLHPSCAGAVDAERWEPAKDPAGDVWPLVAAGERSRQFGRSERASSA